MDEESSTQLLLNSDNKKTDFSHVKSRKLQQNRAANALFCGLILGFVFSFLVAYTGVINDSNTITTNLDYTIDDFITKSNSSSSEPVLPENANIADFLYREVRILCIVVPISKQNLEERGEIFQKTWGKRCHKIIFFTDEQVEFPHLINNSIVLNNKENDWTRLREALSFVYKHYLNKFDWIFKANDHTYAVMENLRWLLYQYDSDWPLLLGQRFYNEENKDDHMVGTYAISKRAFIRLIENGFTNEEVCPSTGTNADFLLTKCLKHLNVLQIDSIDDEGKGLFFQNSPEYALFPTKYDKNYDKYFWHKLKQGPNNCCSDRMVAVQNVHGLHLYYMEYFIYKVHAFGRHRLPEPLPTKKTLEEIVKEKFKK